jgi:hypothetical protein
MNATTANLQLKPTRTVERAGTRAALDRGMGSGGIQNAAERRPAATKNLETIIFHLQPLQLLEIPQNHQSFLWKCLEKTSGYLEKLG